MKKIAINKCYGGFGFSNKAYKRYAELIGKRAYFFNHGHGKDLSLDRYYPCDDEKEEIFLSVFTIPNPNEYLKKNKEWFDMTEKEKKESNERHKSVSLYSGYFRRDDPNVVKVIEELGIEANSRCSDLKVVEIPDDVEW